MDRVLENAAEIAVESGFGEVAAPLVFDRGDLSQCTPGQAAALVCEETSRARPSEGSGRLSR